MCASAAICGRRRLAGANGPYRFISDGELRCFPGRDAVERARTLAAQYVFGQASLALFQYFADADDGSEAIFQRDLKLAIDRVVRLVEILLGVPNGR